MTRCPDLPIFWEGWEAGFMAFHAFHTLSFPWPAFRAAMLDKPICRYPGARRRTRHEMLIGTHPLSLSALEIYHRSGGCQGSEIREQKLGSRE